MTTSPPALLRVRGLNAWIQQRDQVLPLVCDFGIDVQPGQTVCIVGESGCGKSLSVMSMMGLAPSPPIVTRMTSYELGGRDIAPLAERPRKAAIRENLAMIFQEPMSALNPVMRVGDQVMEAIEVRLGVGPKKAREMAIESFRRVGIPAPETRVDEYPHQLSGGMKQRVMIAMALACKPRVLIADEPTTALDVTIQAQILDLLRGLQREEGMGIIMVTHDLGVVAEMADHVIVMYAGHIVESGSVYEIFESPKHPYTQALFRSLPSLAMERGARLHTIEGMVPSASELPWGCRFRTRCEFADEACCSRWLPDNAFSQPMLPERAVDCRYAEAIAAGTQPKAGPFLDDVIARGTLGRTSGSKGALCGETHLVAKSRGGQA